MIELVSIPGGKFLMGSPIGKGDSDEKPQHEVTVQPFFMGKYQVTQAQWKAVTSFQKVNRDLDPDPSYCKGENRPVERVSWEEAVEFCDRLSQHTGKTYRLPTEAEWEYACRAGTTTAFHFGEVITSELANYSEEKTTEVGSFGVANNFGLYDMHGNVLEWCQDVYQSSYENAPTDGSAWISDNNDKYRVLRGGSWDGTADYCRSAYRNRITPAYRDFGIGFRVVQES
jgi:formylglycine-generating enzyme required for sulfatase activity